MTCRVEFLPLYMLQHIELHITVLQTKSVFIVEIVVFIVFIVGDFTFKGVVDFFLGLIVFMGCSQTCVHAAFFFFTHYLSHILPLFHSTLINALIISWFYEAPPSEICDELRLDSWSSVLWLAKPSSILLINLSPIETQRILVKRIVQNLWKHGS